MALELIMGNAGAGKSWTLYQRVIMESMEHPEKNFIVLVPEQFTMQTQEDLVMMHPRHGIMNIDVLSFHRMACRVLKETGRDNKIILDDEGKNLLLRKIAGAFEEQMTVLGGHLKKPGYISEMKSVISEMTQYAYTPEALLDMIQEVGAESYLGKKLSDMQIVYDGFRKYLEEKYITGEELLSVLSDTVKDSGMLKDSVVALEGFTGFTPVQMKLIGELLRVCERVLVTVTVDMQEDVYRYRHPYELFAMSKQMVSALVKKARETGTEIAPETGFGGVPYRFRNRPELLFLEQNLFRYPAGVYKEVPERISLHCTGSVREECIYAAREIRRLVRTKGLRYKDIAVITSSMETYTDHLEKAFDSYGIPLFLDHKRSVLLNSYVEYVRSLLEMIQKGFTADAVFRFLRTGLISWEGAAGFDMDAADLLENYVLAWGIRGWKKWQEPFLRRRKEMPQEELLQVNRIREAFVELLTPLQEALRRPHKTVADITEALCAFLEAQRMPEKVDRLKERFQENGELALAKEYEQICRIVQELFDKFKELLGEETVSVREYTQLLDAGLMEARVGVIPPGMDQVVAGDLQRTRLKEIQVLFVLGLNDAWIPGNLEKNGLLSERDRELLQEKGIRLAPGAKEQTYIQKFYLYQSLTKPSQELYVCYSQMTADGKGLRPAYLVQELKKLFPKLSVQMEEERPLRETELVPQTGLAWVIEGLNRLEEGQPLIQEDWEELLLWYLQEEKWAKRAQRLLDAGLYKNPQEQLEKETARELYGDLEYTSVTRLEQFAACAFAHFLTYGLRLTERPEYEFQALDWGNLLHKALERFSRKLWERGLGWVGLSEEVQESLIEESIQESITEYGSTVLYSSARNTYLITRMKRIMRRTVWALTRQLEHGNFVPEGYEVNFRGGKIDRIDTWENGDKIYVKVLDYKTGMQSFDMAALYYGLQMQLVIYMDAAAVMEEQRHPGKEAVPAGMFYYRIKDPVVAKAVDEKCLEEAILKELRLDGIVNSDEAVLCNLDREMEGNSLVIPAGRKKDGSLLKTSKAVTAEEFSVLRQYAGRKADEMKKEIKDGVIGIAPYEMGKQTACDFCQFKHVCKFEEKLPGYAYRRLAKYAWQDVLAKMKEEN